MAVTATPLSEQEAVDARIALGKRLAAIRTATGINQSFWYTEIRGPETREEKPSSGDRIVREYEKGRRVPTATQLEAYNEAALASENKTAIDLAKNLNADVSALITRGMPDRRVGKLTELLTDSEADGNEEPAPSHPRRVAISVPASRRVRLGAAAALLVVVVVNRRLRTRRTRHDLV